VQIKQNADKKEQKRAEVVAEMEKIKQDVEYFKQ
jgi:hypothetical protein